MEESEACWPVAGGQSKPLRSPSSCPLSSDCSASSSLALEPSSVLLIPVHPPLRMTVEIFCFSFWSDSTDHMEKLRCKIQHFHLMEVLKRTRGPQELRVWGLGETFEYQHQQKILHMKVLFWSNTFSSLQREEVHVWFVFLVWELQVEGRIWALDCILKAWVAPALTLFYFQNQQNMNKVSWWLLNTNCVSNKRKTADLSWPAADLALHSCLTFHVLVSSSHLLKYYLGYFQLRKHKFWSGIWHVTSYFEI